MKAIERQAFQAQGAQHPLGPEHLQAIALARQQGRKIGRAASVAAFSGWTTAGFACLTLVGGLFSFPALALGAGLAVVAYVEVRGSQSLRRFDVEAPKRLGFNQIALFVMLAAYSAWCIIVSLTGPSPYDSYLAAGGDLAATMEPFARLHKTITIAIYAGVIGGSLIAQGCAAAYYFTRRRLIVRYLSSTPAWVVDTLRIAA